MKREYFGMLFIIVSLALIFISEYFFGEEKVKEILNSFIIAWIFIAFQVGQYSMRFPKAF